MRSTSRILAIATAAIVLIAVALSGQTGAATTQRIDRLETGVERAEALRAIKRLQYAYNQYLDVGLWSDAADLFTDTAAADFGSSKINGKAAIRKYWMEQGTIGDGRLNTRVLMQPIVNLGADGRTAKGTWHELGMLGTFGQSATWVGGIYENDYAIENGVWKISGLHFYEQYRGAYEDPGMKGTNVVVPYHFTGEHVGVTIPARAFEPYDHKPKFFPDAIRLANLTARLNRMNDETAVRNLQHSYGYYMDRKLWDDVADLFADNGSWESGNRGAYVGRAPIRKALEVIYGAPALRYGELFDHINLETVVTVSGNTANARTTELCQIGLNNEYARWELGTYENRFVKDGGVWKIQSVRYYPRMITNYDKGWGKEGLPAPGPDRTFPPSKVAKALEIYPKFSYPPFHYANPVTGKAGARATATAVKAAELDAKVADAERMLAGAIGVDATENLMSSYGYYLDDGQWDEMANTFGLQGAKEITGAGVYVGAERIRAILKLRGSQGVGRNPVSYTIHQLVQPVIHVSADGKSAKARLRLFQGGGRMDGSSASWIGGTYENSAFFENGEWKFGVQDLHHHFNATYKNGWAKFTPRPVTPAAPANGAAAPKASGPAAPKGLTAQMAPDKPIRARQYVFPEIDEPAFHYRNPVSGRMPKDLLP